MQQNTHKLMKVYARYQNVKEPRKIVTPLDPWAHFYFNFYNREKSYHNIPFWFWGKTLRVLSENILLNLIAIML